MTSLRRAITRYVAWLEVRAQRHAMFATILTAVAHRLRHILDNTDNPAAVIQFATRTRGVYQLMQDIGDVAPGVTIYTRTATYSPWKEL